MPGTRGGGGSRRGMKTLSDRTLGHEAKTYETHSTVKRPNAILCTRMRSATYKSKIDNGCMQTHKREKKAALFLQ